MIKLIGHQEGTKMFLRNIFEAIQRTGQGKTAVIGWGRGMGHKGHMMLASSVITQAGKVGGDPYFVVSKTVGKDDPITPDEKIAIYKKVFPQSGHIFQPATDEIPDLTRVLANLNQQGYTSVTVVLGADQVKAFQYLKNYNNKPDKSGNILYSFDNLDVISRQETGDPSAGEEGPRATPMRQVLMDPSKSEQEQFAVWRDAMSPEIGDDEVRDLMNKAKERMTAMSAPKPKKAKAVAEGSKKKKKKTSRSLSRYFFPGYGYYGSGESGEGGGGGEGVAEEPSNAMANAASRLANKDDGKVAKLRAAGDKRREEHLKGRNIAKRDTTSKDEWGNLKELSNEKLGQYKKAAGAQASAADKVGNYKLADKRFSGIVKATKKQFANDEKVEELSLFKTKDTKQTDKPKPTPDEMRKYFQSQDKPLTQPSIDMFKKREVRVRYADESKKKGADGKACWDGYRYNGTKNGKDSCVKVSEDVQDVMDILINKIIMNEAIQNNRK